MRWVVMGIALSLQGVDRAEPMTFKLGQPPGAEVTVSIETPLQAEKLVVRAELLDAEGDPLEGRVSYRLAGLPWAPMKPLDPGDFEAELILPPGTVAFQFQVQPKGSPAPQEFSAWTVTIKDAPLDNRRFLIALMLILPGLALANAVIAGIRLKGLVRRVPRITGRIPMDAYKKEVKAQMWMALVQWPLLSIPSVLFFIDLWFLDGPLTDLAYAIGPSLVILAVSRIIRRVEVDAQKIPVEGEALIEEHRHVVATWQGRPTPDW